MDWSEKRIQNALCPSRFLSLSRWLCVPNVTCGVGLTGESDLIAVSNRGYVREIEIKISVSDLKKDLQKVKHLYWEHPKNRIHELYYAMPHWMVEKVNIFEFIPEHAGVLKIIERIHTNGTKYDDVELIKKARKKKAPPITVLEALQLGRLAAFRYWSVRIKEKPNDH